MKTLSDILTLSQQSLETKSLLRNFFPIQHFPVYDNFFTKEEKQLIYQAIDCLEDFIRKIISGESISNITTKHEHHYSYYVISISNSFVKMALCFEHPMRNKPFTCLLIDDNHIYLREIDKEIYYLYALDTRQYTTTVDYQYSSLLSHIVKLTKALNKLMKVKEADRANVFSLEDLFRKEKETTYQYRKKKWLPNYLFQIVPNAFVSFMECFSEEIVNVLIFVLLNSFILLATVPKFFEILMISLLVFFFIICLSIYGITLFKNKSIIKQYRQILKQTLNSKENLSTPIQNHKAETIQRTEETLKKLELMKSNMYLQSFIQSSRLLLAEAKENETIYESISPLLYYYLPLIQQTLEEIKKLENLKDDKAAQCLQNELDETLVVLQQWLQSLKGISNQELITHLQLVREKLQATPFKVLSLEKANGN